MNRPGRTARTAKKDDAFFAAMSSGLPIGECCTIAGYARTCVYGYREKDAEFARRWQEADEAAVERMEKEADRRAIEGTEEPVFHQGVECGRIRKFSDTLLIFRLKAKRPEVYRERTENKVLTEDVTLDDNDRVARLAALLDKARARRDRRPAGGRSAKAGAR